MTGASFWSQFELRQLRCFVAAAEELHFGRAAARMNMTQPPLSRQIQLLEHVLGVKLLDRTSRAVKLTPAGRVFLLEARRILRLTESAALATRRIAIAPRDFVSAYAAKHPQEDFAETFRFYVTRRGRLRELFAEFGRKRKGVILYEKFLVLHDFVRALRGWS